LELTTGMATTIGIGGRLRVYMLMSSGKMIAGPPSVLL
jgi:hypothetical protein